MIGYQNYADMGIPEDFNPMTREQTIIDQLTGYQQICREIAEETAVEYLQAAENEPLTDDDQIYFGEWLEEAAYSHGTEYYGKETPRDEYDTLIAMREFIQQRADFTTLEFLQDIQAEINPS